MDHEEKTEFHLVVCIFPVPAGSRTRRGADRSWGRRLGAVFEEGGCGAEAVDADNVEAEIGEEQVWVC